MFPRCRSNSGTGNEIDGRSFRNGGFRSEWHIIIAGSHADVPAPCRQCPVYCGGWRQAGNTGASPAFSRTMGFKLFATEGTFKFLNENGIESRLINKIFEGRPNIVDAIKTGEINLVINTPRWEIKQLMILI